MPFEPNVKREVIRIDPSKIHATMKGSNQQQHQHGFAMREDRRRYYCIRMAHSLHILTYKAHSLSQLAPELWNTWGHVRPRWRTDSFVFSRDSRFGLFADSVFSAI